MSLNLPGFVRLWWHRLWARRWEHKRLYHAGISVAAEVARNEHENAYSWLLYEAQIDDWAARRRQQAIAEAGRSGDRT